MLCFVGKKRKGKVMLSIRLPMLRTPFTVFYLSLSRWSIVEILDRTLVDNDEGVAIILSFLEER